MVNLRTKFEVSNFIHVCVCVVCVCLSGVPLSAFICQFVCLDWRNKDIYYEDMNGDANVEYGVVWGVMGRSSSSAMSPFDRPHATSYSSIIDWNLLWSNNVANLK